MAYLPDYDMTIAGTLVAGADIWLNTPRPPMEASGTSGMKAAVNGTLNFSRARRLVDRGLDRGRHRLGDRRRQGPGSDAEHAASLYDKLERTDPAAVLRTDRARWRG